ncbi:MAG: HAD-IC family P-type ATPase [Acidimicrobiales bacterium]
MAASLPAADDEREYELTGLTGAEVEARVAAGHANDDAARPSRTVAQIVRANVFTRFNAILGALLAVIVVVGPLQDALFGIVLVANTAIGIIQEVRAKRALDQLAVLAAPKVVALRDGAPVELPVERVVLDDVLRLRPGDQVVVDGTVLRSEALEIDESLLTGESEPVGKDAGDEVLSGSFAAAGNGWYRATRVGADAYAATLAHAARRFTLVRSELRAGIDRILRVVMWVMIPTAALLVSSQLLNNEDLDDALRGSVAGVGSMIPEGLVLLTSVAMAVGVVRLGRRGVLVQELAAIEVLARVDVVCFDKTGTLTEGSMAVAGVETLDGADARNPLGALAAADATPNASMLAVAAAFPAPEGWDANAIVPFSSARKWSGADFGHRGAWLLGAPEVLLDRAPMGPETDAVGAAAARRAGEGQRVLLLARSASVLPEPSLPATIEPVALISLEDRVRPEAAATLEYFANQGVALKVMSGDDPLTVGSIARRLGLDTTGGPVDARRLPDDDVALARAMEDHVVFGRVSPHQKRDMVTALQAKGHVVAMVGDGVNDVLALKDADIGVAFGSGSGASRAVAQLVLVENSFDSLPPVVGEGRRVIANVERVANLFLTKTVYATLLALAVGVARLPFPFLPRHLTVVTALTIGTPAFILALAPNAARAQPHFVRRVLSFANPGGTVAAAATFLVYALAREEGTPLAESRTAATIVLFAVGFWVLTAVARPLTTARRWLLAGLACSFVCVLAVPGLRDFFGIDIPSPLTLATVVAVAAVAVAGLESGWRLTRRLHPESSSDVSG